MSGTPLSSYLRMLREKNDYTQSQLAKVMGVSRANYSHYENARITPSNDGLCKLADFYNVPLSKLVRLAGSNYESEDTKELLKTDSTVNDGSYDRFYNDFLKECAEMSTEEISKWLSIDDRELIYYYHKISERDRRLIFYLIRIMLLNKGKSRKD